MTKAVTVASVVGISVLTFVYYCVIPAITFFAKIGANLPR
jgi:hypothetical protein